MRKRVAGLYLEIKDEEGIVRVSIDQDKVTDAHRAIIREASLLLVRLVKMQPRVVTASVAGAK